MPLSKQIWLTTGYEILALSGTSALKVEQLARKVGISKSSFYHYFADLEVYLEELLRYHVTQAGIIAEKEKKAQQILPDLVEILLEHRMDLLFSRQLRFHRDRVDFADTVRQTDALIGDAILKLWIRDLNLPLSDRQLEGIFSLALENFYLQINPANLSSSWLTAYFTQLRKIAEELV
jgi:AcrR family transcriptional regulator